MFFCCLCVCLLWNSAFEKGGVSQLRMEGARMEYSLHMMMMKPRKQTFLSFPFKVVQERSNLGAMFNMVTHCLLEIVVYSDSQSEHTQLTMSTYNKTDSVVPTSQINAIKTSHHKNEYLDKKNINIFFNKYQ